MISEIINDNKQLLRVLYFHSVVKREALIPTSNMLEHGSLDKLGNLTQIANLFWIREGALCSGALSKQQLFGVPKKVFTLSQHSY